MPAEVTKEIIYARLEEIRRLSELIRDTHHDCVFKQQQPGHQFSHCMVRVSLRPPGAIEEPDEVTPEQVLGYLKRLAILVQELIPLYAKLYEL